MATIFSKIIAGELPGHFVWRDEEIAAFMTIAPIRPGHVLVVPVEEIDHWDDVPGDMAIHCLDVSRNIAKALKAVYSPLRVSLQIVGLEVPHTHIHLVPITEMQDVSFANAKMAEAADLAAEAAKIRAQLVAMGHAEADIS